MPKEMDRYGAVKVVSGNLKGVLVITMMMI